MPSCTSDGFEDLLDLLQATRRNRDLQLNGSVVAAEDEKASRIGSVGGPVRLKQEPVEGEFELVGSRHVLVGLDLDRYELAAALVHSVWGAANLQV